MVRLRIFGSGRILLTDESDKVIDDFVVADVDKAQEIAMEHLKKWKERENEYSNTN